MRKNTQKKANDLSKEQIETIVKMALETLKVTSTMPIPAPIVVETIEEWYYSFTGDQIMISKDKAENGPFPTYSKAHIAAIEHATSLLRNVRAFRKSKSATK